MKSWEDRHKKSKGHGWVGDENASAALSKWIENSNTSLPE